MRDLLQPARANTVCALLVFLHLLERQTERVPQLLLAHRKHHPAHAHPATHVPVDGIWGLFGAGHNNLLWCRIMFPQGGPKAIVFRAKLARTAKSC